MVAKQRRVLRVRRRKTTPNAQQRKISRMAKKRYKRKRDKLLKESRLYYKKNKDTISKKRKAKRRKPKATTLRV